MIGRNELCLCGSGKKFKKCCQNKHLPQINTAYNIKLQQIIQTFSHKCTILTQTYAFRQHLDNWQQLLTNHLSDTTIKTIAFHDYFFHKKLYIWTNYLKQVKKTLLHPATISVLKNWATPTLFIGRVDGIYDDYFLAQNSFTADTIYIRRESNETICTGMYVYCFILPDYLDKKSYFLPICHPLFFQKEYSPVFKQLAIQYAHITLHDFKPYYLQLWRDFIHHNNPTDKEPRIKHSVVTETIHFLERYNRDSQNLVEVLENYLLDQQPTARKEQAIVAGAIRFGQEKGLFESLSMTVKEIAASFEVSPSSLNKYYQDLRHYCDNKQHTEKTYQMS